MSLSFESHDHNDSPVLDEPKFLFSWSGDLRQFQEFEESDNLQGSRMAMPESPAGAFDEAPEPVTESPRTGLERLNLYMENDFARLDADQDGLLNRQEIEHSEAVLTSLDEVGVLAWMSSNMEALEKLGDKESGISLKDIDSFNKVAETGTGDIAFAFRHADWMTRTTSSFAGGFGGALVARKFFDFPVTTKSALGWTAALFGAMGAADAIGYYCFEKPKIDKAISELNLLPDKMF